MSTSPQTSLEQIVQEDVIDALVSEGFTHAQAESGLKCGTGVTFSELFKSSLNWLTTTRGNGRLKANQSSTGVERSHPPSAGRSAEPGRSMPPSVDSTQKEIAVKTYCPGYKRECGEVLKKSNRNGLCARCYSRKWYAENRAAGNSRPAKAKAHKPRSTWAANNRAPKVYLADAPPSGDRVTLAVTEAQLNQFLVRLSLEDKQRLANHFLQSAEE